MNTGHLTERQIEILKSLRDAAENKGNRQLLNRAISGKLPKDGIEAVCQMINDEFLMKGIKENYEPNDYGRELESLLDIINRPRISE